MEDNNFFLNSYPFNAQQETKTIQLLNKIIAKLRLPLKLSYRYNSMINMNTLEQRINMYNHLSDVLQLGVEGEIVELGCFKGQSAILFQQTNIQFSKLMRETGRSVSSRELHLFDSFDKNFSYQGDVITALRQSFLDLNLPVPFIHKGLFSETLQRQLPQKIAFAHIDCGFGGDPFEHAKVVEYCLQQIYPKMSRNSVCFLMDYHSDEAGDNIGFDVNPGVKIACDKFFTDKPEKVISLYGGEYSHGYFRKV